MGAETDRGLRRVVATVAMANLAWFGVEFAVASAIGSVSLFADSADFLEDASLNLLVLLALGWSSRVRARVGLALSVLLLAPGVATVWMAWTRFTSPGAPDPVALGFTGLGALAVNFGCALLLVRRRDHGGSLTRAAFLSARNDVLASLAIMAAGAATAITHVRWWDLGVGLAIGAMNADAARTVWRAARREGRVASAI
ncbi:MAG: Co/Zn/Cd efflux system component [Caulobacteraceae bacterium]|jgi:Co/Zn/Cd efflux system component|nr:Co/Zn/Cd efflux system component [Caulobacteraceae bacterium]